MRGFGAVAALAIGVLLAGLFSTVSVPAAPASAEPAPIGAGAPGKGGPIARAANVTVKVGGVRSGRAIAPLAGVTYQFYQATVSGGRGTIVAGATCTTDATGMCNVSLPPRAVGNGSRYGYVAEATGVPDGYHLIPQLTTGTANSTSTVDYFYQTGPISDGESYTIPVGVPAAVERDQTTSGTAMPAAVDNPTLATKCGLNVGLVLDLSSSVSANDATYLRQAATGYVNVLAGTPSRVSVTTFGRTSPAASTSGSNNTNLGLTSVATAASADVVRNKIAGLRVPGNEATNWDAGLQAAATMAQDLDLVLVLTDGMPTRYSFDGDGSGTRTRYIELEHAIASANQLKASDVTVQAVGIGSGISGDPANLMAISGPVANTDYFQVPSYQQLVAFLQGHAGVGCASTVNVTKTVIPSGGGAPQPASGWTMTASTDPDPIVKESDTDDEFATTADADTGSTGVASFTLDLNSDQSHEVEVRETQLDGFHLVPQSGRNAVCFDTLDPSTPLPVTNLDDDPNSPGFSVMAPGGKTVSCEIRNQAESETAQARVHKEWYFDLEGDGQFDGPYAPSDELPIPGLSAALSLSGAGVPAPPHAFDTVYGNLVPGQSLDVQETVAGLPPLCENEATGIGLHPLTGTGPGPNPVINEIAIENRVTCHSSLTLEKELASVSDSAAVGDWLLNSFPIGSPAAAPGVRDAVTGTDAATADVTSNVRYALNEDPQTDEARDEWVQRWSPSLTGQWEPAVANGATGSWVCVLLMGFDDTGQPVWSNDQFDGRNGGVTVPVGQWAKCVAENRSMPELELVKRVMLNGVEQAPDAELAENWTLGATWQSPIEPIDGVPFTPPRTQAPVSGVGGLPEQTVLTGSYALEETGSAPGYVNGDTWSCTLDNQPDPVVVDAEHPRLNLESGVNGSCTIVNKAIQPTLRLDKTVYGPDAPENWVLTGTPLETLDPPSPIVTNPDGGATEATEVWSSTGYRLSEVPAPGFDDGDYVRGDWSCEVVDGPASPAPEVEQIEPGVAELSPLAVGQVVDCEVENRTAPATVELGKGFDGPGHEDDWVLTGSDDQGVVVNAEEQPGHVDPVEVEPGTDLQLGERAADGIDGSGYAFGEWSCEVVDGPAEPAPVVTQGAPGQATLGGLAPRQDVACEVVNRALQPGLGLEKTVSGPGGGTADDWVLYAIGDGGSELNPDGAAGNIPVQPVGLGEAFELSEAPFGGFDDGRYQRLGWSCEVVDGPTSPAPAVENRADGSASLAPLAPGQQVVCTAENRAADPVPPGPVPPGPEPGPTPIPATGFDASWPSLAALLLILAGAATLIRRRRLARS